MPRKLTLDERVCPCGCLQSFAPAYRGQIYLNHQHQERASQARRREKQGKPARPEQLTLFEQPTRRQTPKTGDWPTRRAAIRAATDPRTHKYANVGK